MPLRFDSLSPQPPGFGQCQRCAYRRSGSVEICFTCASRYTDLPPPARCALCSHPLETRDARCGNPICNWEPVDRWYGRVRAIALDSGPMHRVIRRYKYEEKTAWARILARVILGYLEEHAEEFRNYDALIPMPAFTGHGAHRSWSHIDHIVQHTDIEDPHGWPFRPDRALIVKTAETETMSGKIWQRRHDIASKQLRAALQIPDPATVSGQRVLVIDDVFTTGHDMLEVARALRLAGAAAVDGLVLARAQWRQRV